MTPGELFGYAVALGESEGGEFDWGKLQWRTK